MPAGNTGNVDVVDVATGKVTTVGGFPTAPRAAPGPAEDGTELGGRRAMASVWIGNRASNEICAVDARDPERVAPAISCRPLPDGLAYVRRQRPARSG